MARNANFQRLDDLYEVTDKILGTGGFSIVKLGVNRKTGQYVAVKTVNRVSNNLVKYITNTIISQNYQKRKKLLLGKKLRL